MSDSSPEHGSAIRSLVRGIVGLGVSPETLAGVESQLFFDIWDHEVGLRLPVLDAKLREQFAKGIEHRIRSYIED